MKHPIYSIARISLIASIILHISGSVYASSIGDDYRFHVSPDYDAQGASWATATIRAVSRYAYFYVDDRFWGALTLDKQSQYISTLNQLATEFDTAIYPRATALWGGEPNPGIDNDPRMTILLEQIIEGAGGYFQTINEYSIAQFPDSNVREMLYINADSVTNGNAKSYIAHEFQHLISFNQKEVRLGVSDDVWLNESRSEYNVTVAGYSEPFQNSALDRRARAFLRSPSDSLVEWPNVASDYAIASMFIHYLIDRFGQGLAVSMIHSRASGISAIDEWLQLNGIPERFPQVFSDWMVATAVNDKSLGDQYGYTRAGLASVRVMPQQSALVGEYSESMISSSLKDWQPAWFQFDAPYANKPAMVLTVTGQVGPWWGGAYVATYQDGHRVASSFSTDSTGRSVMSAPMSDGGARLSSVMLALARGVSTPMGEKTIVQSLPVMIRASLGEVVATPAPMPIPSPVIEQLVDGDLMRRQNESEIYVVWGKYRRYLPQGVLALYGFQNRPVIPVSDEVFNRYITTNYVRAINGKKVYTLWPDGTKHWLNISAEQFDATSRDWNSIFIVNNAEVAFYATGPDIKN